MITRWVVHFYLGVSFSFSLVAGLVLRKKMVSFVCSMFALGWSLHIITYLPTYLYFIRHG